MGRRRPHALPPRTPDVRAGADPRRRCRGGHVRGAGRRRAARGRRRRRAPDRRTSHGAPARRRRRADRRPEVRRSRGARAASCRRPRGPARRGPPVAPARGSPRDRGDRTRGGRGVVGEPPVGGRAFDPADPRGVREPRDRGPVPDRRRPSARHPGRGPGAPGALERAPRGGAVARARLAGAVRRRVPARRRVGRARGSRHRLGGPVAADPPGPGPRRRIAARLGDLRRAGRGGRPAPGVREPRGAPGRGGAAARTASGDLTLDGMDRDRAPATAG